MRLKENLLKTKFIHQLWKKIIFDPYERSVFQLLEQYIRGEKNAPKAYRSIAKAQVKVFANVLGNFNILY